MTCLEDRTVRGKKAGTEEGTGREEADLEAPGWGRGCGRAPGVSSAFPVSLGTLPGSAYTPLSTAGLLLTPKASKALLGPSLAPVWRLGSGKLAN